MSWYGQYHNAMLSTLSKSSLSFLESLWSKYEQNSLIPVWPNFHCTFFVHYAHYDGYQNEEIKTHRPVKRSGTTYVWYAEDTWAIFEAHVPVCKLHPRAALKYAQLVKFLLLPALLGNKQ